MIEALAFVAVLSGVYTLIALLVCSWFSPHREHWWCPACRLLGKRGLL